MKLKKYSKQLGSSSSMLLTRDPGSKTGFVSLRLNPRLTVLDLSHQGITCLQGIQVYKDLEGIDLSTCSFKCFDDLLPLRRCRKLKQIRIFDTPLNQSINLPMRVITVVPQIQMVNGLCVAGETLASLQQLQMDIGDRVTSFLLQKCRIGMEVMGSPKRKRNWEPLRQELSQVKSVLALENQEPLGLMDLNWQIKSHLPLSSISVPPCPPQTHQQITKYLLDSVLMRAADSRPQFVEKLLGKIDVLNQDEQHMISKQVLVAKQILKMEMYKEWQSQQQAQQPLNTTNELKNHFTSAQTALDSNDRYGYPIRKTIGDIYFLLDEDYVQVIRELLIQQCDFLLEKIPVEASNLDEQRQQIQIKIRSNSVDSLEIQQKDSDGGCSQQNLATYTKWQQSCSPKNFTFNPTPARTYGNPNVLTNIILCLQKWLVAHIFRKIRTHRSKNLLQRISQALQLCLKRQIVKICHEGFEMIAERSDQLKNMLKTLEKLKLKRLFGQWRRVKKRKIAILKKLLKRKSKADEFMKLICLTKWKMNCRAASLHKMASQVLISQPRKDPLPVSRKGVNLAYLRVKADFQLRQQLRIGKY